MSDNTKKHISHTKEEITEILDVVRKNVLKDNFIICATSKNYKNVEFIKKYNLHNNKQKEILLELNVCDFCYSVDNYKNPKERLYIFYRKYELNSWGEINEVDIYIKIAIKFDECIVVISFHEPEKKLKKLFE